MELNPNHPVTREVSDQWYKYTVAAAVRPPKPGQVQLDNGKFADRDKVVFLLQADKKNPAILYATDRAYRQAPDGSLRRVIPKMSKQERRQAKRNHKNQQA